LVEEVLQHWPGRWEAAPKASDPHENECLRLSIDRAVHELGWQPVWDFPGAVERTIHWYRAFLSANRQPATALVDDDIDAYARAAKKLGLSWTQ
jgi:dTDP-D-glucose 4,6-dehydratase